MSKLKIWCFFAISILFGVFVSERTELKRISGKKATLMSIQRNSINLSIIVVNSETKNSKYQGPSNKNLTFIDTK